MSRRGEGRQLRVKRQAARRQQYGDDYVTGKVKAAQAEMAESDRIAEEVGAKPFRQALWDTSTVIGTALSPIGDVVEYAMPDAAKEAIASGVQSLAETELGQEAIQYAQERPGMMRDLGAAGNILGLIPGAAAVKGGLNTVARTMPTMLPGFYGGGMGGKIAAAGKGSLRAAPAAIADSVNPRAIAYERETGIPYSKGKGSGEIGSGTREQEISYGSAQTVDSIRRQMGRGPARFIAEGPIGVIDTIDVLPATDTKTIREQLFGRGNNIRVDVPEVIQNRAMNHMYKVHGIDKDSKKRNAQIKIKRPAGVNRVGDEGVVGSSQKSSIVLNMLSDQKDVVTGKRTKPTLSKKEILKRKGKRALPEKAVEKIVNRKGILSGEALKKEVNKFRIGTEDATKVPSLKTWLKKNKNRALSGATEGDLTQYFASQGIKVNKGGKGDPHIYIGSSHHSQSKELGGVNDFIAINPKTGDVYTLISDGHDLFGVNPVGGGDLVAAVPMQKSNFKRKTAYTPTRNTETGAKDPKLKARVDASVDRLEGLSGIKINKGESPVDYHFRVIREFEAKVEPKDKAVAGRRAAVLTAGAQPFIGAPAAADEER
jgi:hypothetical protein